MSPIRRLVLAALALLAGCATVTPSPVAQDKCGNPCASMSCPSAFRCAVDGNCTARCQPEPAPRSY